MKKILKNKILWSNVLVFLVTAFTIYFTTLRYSFVSPPDVKDVDPKSFYEEYKKNPNDFIFIDVRQQAAYNNQHAMGSINIPLQNFYFEKSGLPKNTNKTIVLICSLGTASGVGYGYLEHYGFRNIQRVHGGIENWVNNDLPTQGQSIINKFQTGSSTSYLLNIKNIWLI